VKLIFATPKIKDLDNCGADVDSGQCHAILVHHYTCGLIIESVTPEQPAIGTCIVRIPLKRYSLFHRPSRVAMDMERWACPPDHEDWLAPSVDANRKTRWAGIVASSRLCSLQQFSSTGV